MAQRDNLYRRSSGIYVVRIAVPARYRLYTGQREIHASTETNDIRKARAIAAGLFVSIPHNRAIHISKSSGKINLPTMEIAMRKARLSMAHSTVT